MRFRFLSDFLIAAILIAAVEVWICYVISTAAFRFLDVVLICSVVVATWGAIFFCGKRRTYCLGFSVAAWAIIVYGAQYETEWYLLAMTRVPASPLAHKVAVWTGRAAYPDIAGGIKPKHELNADSLYDFFRTWNHFAVLNAGLLGGYFARRTSYGAESIKIVPEAGESE